MDQHLKINIFIEIMNPNYEILRFVMQNCSKLIEKPLVYIHGYSVGPEGFLVFEVNNIQDLKTAQKLYLKMWKTRIQT